MGSMERKDVAAAVDVLPRDTYDGRTEWPGLLRKVARERPGFDRSPPGWRQE
jgi:hypothetical protein